MQSSEVGTILIVFFFVLLTLVGIVGLHLGSLALARAGWIPSPSGASFIILVVLIAAGAIGLWKTMGSFWGPEEGIRSLPQSMKVSAIFLYLAGSLVYVELRSLLSRGYSVRILVDLHTRGASASLGSLKSGYGGGVGVRGMLAKRVGTLAGLGLLRFRGNRVGPLTPLGKVCAVAGERMRQLLRLELVG